MKMLGLILGQNNDPEQLKLNLDKRIKKIGAVTSEEATTNWLDSTFTVENLFGIRGYKLSKETKALIQTLKELGHLEDVEFLINKKLDNNISFFQFFTCYGVQWEDIKFLIEKGGDLNLQYDYGNSAVHYIAGNKMLNLTEEKIDYLIDHGADFDVKNINNLTPLNTSISYLDTYDKKFAYADYITIYIGRLPNHLDGIMVFNDPDKTSVEYLLDKGFQIDFNPAFSSLFNILSGSIISKPQTLYIKLIHKYILEKNLGDVHIREFLENDKIIKGFNKALDKHYKSLLSRENDIIELIEKNANNDNVKDLRKEWEQIDYNIEVIKKCFSEKEKYSLKQPQYMSFHAANCFIIPQLKAKFFDIKIKEISDSIKVAGSLPDDIDDAY
ncbi:MAG TPA: hypothetical protein QKA08_05145 [Candidatus Megaira endosymbiont of Nemacystus decipiens]|nr:hypothetical protein [Candidatus Megaera endosymbiont of Nemacystus decipiens]